MPARPTPTEIVAALRAAGCVYAEDEARLLVAEAGTASELAAMLQRRVAGIPLEHVLGWAEFCGLRIAVDPGVFVPRRRTEFLVQRAAAHLPAADGAAPVVVDLCCGSGAVGVALSAAVSGIDLYAVDLDPAAVRCARRNVTPVGGRVYQGDLYQPLPTALRGRVDIVVANAPYVPTQAIALMPPEARLQEATMALDGGDDGLDVLRRVVAAVGPWLAPAGHLLVETSERQAPDVVAAAARAGLVAAVARSAELEGTVVAAARAMPS